MSFLTTEKLTEIVEANYEKRVSLKRTDGKFWLHTEEGAYEISGDHYLRLYMYIESGSIDEALQRCADFLYPPARKH